MKLVVLLQHERSTKGTHVYTTDDPEAPIPTLYIRKSGLPTTPPAAISVTVEPVEN